MSEYPRPIKQNERLEHVGTICPPGRTKQSSIEECDINEIIRRFEATGQLTHISNVLPKYGDFTNADDYKTVLDQTIQLEAEFATLPASTRSRFDNDPSKLLEFLSDENNRDEAIELGLHPAKPDASLESAASTPPPEREETPTPTGEE